jgi:hypothetical protein
MAVNTGNNPGSSWEKDKQNPSAEEASNATLTSGLAKGGLGGLFTIPSMTSDNRNLREVSDTLEQIQEIYKRAKNSTTAELQLRIIPEVENMTSAISPVLPGLCFYREIGGTMYVMGALFSNRQLCISSEYIRVNSMNYGGVSQSVSAPLPPASYADKNLVDNLKAHYTKVGEAKGSKLVTVINLVVVDLEMLDHPEAGEVKDRAHTLAAYLTGQWEEAILVKVPQELAVGGVELPSPFALKATPYGKDGHAEARVSAISGRVTVGKTLSAANMEVIASTMNNINNQQASSANSKEIARVTATVSLNAQSFQAYIAGLQASSGRQQQEALQRMMNLGGGIYPQGYRPLAPVITIEEAVAGEMMSYNQGLYPYFFGLYLLMSTNNNFVFAEALRKQSVGARGNLANLEVRIDEMLAQVGVIPNRIVLTEKTVSDTDLVNQWIRQNVSPHATFQVNINPCGPHAPIQNFLVGLAGKNRKEEVQTMVAILNALSNNAFSAIIERNIKANSGWNPSLPVLHRTPVITVNGLAEIGGKKLNTQELDEMMLGHLKGKGGTQAIQQYLATQYGMTQEDFKARCQKLRIELNQSVFDGAVHINSFSQTHIWDPLLMSAIGEAMDGIGTLNVANNLGSFRTNNLVYAPGAGLATYASVGSNNPNGSNISASYGLNQSFG